MSISSCITILVVNNSLWLIYAIYDECRRAYYITKDAWCCVIRFDEIISKNHMKRYAEKLGLSESDFVQLCIDYYIVSQNSDCIYSKKRGV